MILENFNLYNLEIYLLIEVQWFFISIVQKIYIFTNNENSF